LLFCIFFIFNKLYAQIDNYSVSIDTVFTVNDTIFLSQDTLFSHVDTLFAESDTLNAAIDSLLLSTDSLFQKKRLSPEALQSSVKYISQDSIIINLKKKQILLFEDAKAYYEDIELNAAFMEFGFVQSELYASGMADSCGHIHGPPIFKQGKSEFCSQEVRYNFKSKKGKVTTVITEEGDGFIHGRYVKHVDEKTSYIKGGQYTTCNLEHPHFQIRFNKAKVIQDDKIITGPAYISFGNVPTPIAIPFGYFPIQKDRASGIVIPTYGESDNRGFYFENFGYYFGISDKFDLLLAGDITTRGSWAAKAKANYVARYKCAGVLEMSFTQNYFGERQTKERYHTNDFRVHWSHKQDPKFHPTTRFSTYIDVLSSTHNKYNPSSTSDYLSNQFTSSMNFSTNAKEIFFVDGAIYYTQNTYTKEIGISLPEINLAVRQFYPFRKKYKAGKLKWYDNISLKWSSQMANKINTYDTLFMLPKTWQEIKTGIQHSIPLNIPVKLGKAFNWNTNATLTEKWYLQRNGKTFNTIYKDTLWIPNIDNVFQRGFYALHDVSLSTSITTKVFFNWSYKKGALKVIRHVMSPDVGFTYRPNLSGNTTGTYFNTMTGKEVEYHYFSGAMYGMVGSKTQAIARFTVNNNLEIKVNSKKDTITGTRKVTIFDNVSISCGYDFAADSLRWQPLTISGRTSFFSFLDVTFRLSFDPYIINNEGSRVNKTEAKVNKRAMRFTGSDLNIGINWRLNQDFFKKKKNEENRTDKAPQQQESIFPENTLGMPNKRPGFSNPWNITINYTFAYTTSENYGYYIFRTEKQYEKNIVQTINFSGDVNITRKWKIGFTTGYDIKNKDFSYTSIDIYRDLHCWEMRFNWIPLGYRKGWSFQINVKASVLQDLKYKMQRDFRDNF
jgi:lipopolysaccharide assembly outer membrane protein LptD (OstA)